MKYQATIGLEMHCELKSNSKVFSQSRNSYNNIPNDNVAPLDMAFPGTLPMVNHKCVSDAIKMALVLNCKIPEYMSFDRKNYYYPDLPKGYQITQFYNPVGTDGNIDILVNDEVVNIKIHDIHLEEDAASLDHYTDTSVIDYNRAGVPLLELVTEPCIHNADTAVAFLEHMRNTYKYCDVSEGDTKKGQIRCDVNVSLSKDDTLGTKVEIKNVNSFGAVRDVIEYEIQRQSALLDEGKADAIEQETRRWDEESKQTIRMRSKADAIDYKYFPDPNIPPYEITKEEIEEIKSTIPILPIERKKIYEEQYGLSSYDAKVIIKEKSVSDYFEECLKLGIPAKLASNWLTTSILGKINELDIPLEEFYLKPEYLKQIIDSVSSGAISSKQAKEIFNNAIREEKEPKTYLKDNNQLSDKEELETIIKGILANNESQIEAYHNGKTNLFDYFVGQVMKETKGKANPVLTKEILNTLLNKE